MPADQQGVAVRLHASSLRPLACQVDIVQQGLGIRPPGKAAGRDLHCRLPRLCRRQHRLLRHLLCLQGSCRRM